MSKERWQLCYQHVLTETPLPTSATADDVRTALQELIDDVQVKWITPRKARDIAPVVRTLSERFRCSELAEQFEAAITSKGALA